MTEAEICSWLGLPEDSKLPDRIVRGMAAIADDRDEVAVFAAFLNCAGPAPRADNSYSVKLDRDPE